MHDVHLQLAFFDRWRSAITLLLSTLLTHSSVASLLRLCLREVRIFDLLLLWLGVIGVLPSMRIGLIFSLGCYYVGIWRLHWLLYELGPYPVATAHVVSVRNEARLRIASYLFAAVAAALLFTAIIGGVDVVTISRQMTAVLGLRLWLDVRVVITVVVLRCKCGQVLLLVLLCEPVFA